MKKLSLLSTLFLAITLLVAQENNNAPCMHMSEDDAANIRSGNHYSPYAGRNFPTQVYWGETHLHTDNSLDARGFGAMVDPDEAFRFAKGEEITTSTGLQFKIGRSRRRRPIPPAR